MINQLDATSRNGDHSHPETVSLCLVPMLFVRSRCAGNLCVEAGSFVDIQIFTGLPCRRRCTLQCHSDSRRNNYQCENSSSPSVSVPLRRPPSAAPTVPWLPTTASSTSLVTTVFSSARSVKCTSAPPMALATWLASSSLGSPSRSLELKLRAVLRGRAVLFFSRVFLSRGAPRSGTVPARHVYSPRSSRHRLSRSARWMRAPPGCRGRWGC